MKNLFILLFILFSSSVFAQQLPDFSLFRENAFLYNPAVAGTDQASVIGLSVRKQWTNIDRSPTTVAAFFQTAIDAKNIGLGATIFNDFIGPTSFTGLSGSFAYNITLSEERPGVSHYKVLSFGLSASLRQYRINGTNIQLDQAQDDAILAGKSTQFYPDASFGIFYKSRTLFASASIPQLLSLNVPFSDNYSGETKYKTMQHYYAMFGGRIFVGKNKDASSHQLYIEPAVNFHYIIRSQPQAMLSARFAMKDVFFVGAGYRTASTVMFEGGFTVKKQFKLAYSYDMAAGDFRADVGQVHEVSLIFDFGRVFGSY